MLLSLPRRLKTFNVNSIISQPSLVFKRCLNVSANSEAMGAARAARKSARMLGKNAQDGENTKMITPGTKL